MQAAASGPLRSGDVALAIGNPFGIGQTVAREIVNATGRSRLGLSLLENFIRNRRLDNPGNSGRALIHTRGGLVGVNRRRH